MTNKLLRRREVCDRTGLSYTTIWRYERAGMFPRRVLLNPHAAGMNAAVAWHEREIEKWIHERVRIANRAALPEPEAA